MTAPDPCDFDACPVCTDAVSVVWHSGVCPNGADRIRLYERAPRPTVNGRDPYTRVGSDPHRVIRKIVQPYEPGTVTLGDIARRDANVGTPEWQAWAQRRAS